MTWKHGASLLFEWNYNFLFAIRRMGFSEERTEFMHQYLLSNFCMTDWQKREETFMVWNLYTFLSLHESHFIIIACLLDWQSSLILIYGNLCECRTVSVFLIVAFPEPDMVPGTCQALNSSVKCLEEGEHMERKRFSWLTWL